MEKVFSGAFSLAIGKSAKPVHCFCRQLPVSLLVLDQCSSGKILSTLLLMIVMVCCCW